MSDTGLRTMQSFIGSQCRCCLKLNEGPKSLLSFVANWSLSSQRKGDKCLGAILIKKRKHPSNNNHGRTASVSALDVHSK